MASKSMRSMGMTASLPGMKCLEMNAAEDAIKNTREVVPGMVDVIGMESNSSPQPSPTHTHAMHLP